MINTNKYSHLYNEYDIDILALNEDVFECNHWEDDGDDFFVDVSADCHVTQFFYGFITRQVSEALSSMKPGNRCCIPELLDIFLWDYLSAEGRRAAQQCVEHMVREEGLPLVCSGNGMLTRI